MDKPMKINYGDIPLWDIEDIHLPEGGYWSIAMVDAQGNVRTALEE